MAGCIIEIKDLLPPILLYYSSLFMGLQPLAQVQPEAVRFAEGLLEQMKTTTPLAGTMALGYFFAHKEVLTMEGRIPSPDPREPDVRIASIMLRTWSAWAQFLLTFQERLFAFANNRKPAFQ